MSDKKKYYMRGLGFGILITAIILMIVHRNDAMTDAKAIKRAKELGYVLSEEVNAAPTQAIDIDALKAKLTDTPEPIPTPVTEDLEPLPNGDPDPDLEPLPNGDPDPDLEPLPNGDPDPDLIE